MFLNHINFLNNNSRLFYIDFHYRPNLSFIFSCKNYNFIIFLYFRVFFPHVIYSLTNYIGITTIDVSVLPINIISNLDAQNLMNPEIQRTSGASDIIFIKFFVLNSLATGPNILVPTGSLCCVINTAELSSNFIYDPSTLRIPLAVLTITARTTSPFLTLELGMASFTETTIISPTVAYFLFDPPNTLIQERILAPELSATLNLV